MSVFARLLSIPVLAFAGLLGGCGERDQQAYAKGWNEGYEEGLAEGRSEGRAEAEIDHQQRWGLIGLGLGAVAGAALVAFATRKHLAEQWRKRRRRKELERMVGACKVDGDLQAEVMAIARKRATLQDRLEGDDGPLIRVLADRLRPELLRLDTQLLDIAALLQQLRVLRRDIVPDDEPANAVGVHGSAEGAGRSGTAGALQVAEEQRRSEVRKNAENIARCESQLAGLAAFLDELTMRLGNLKAIEQVDAFDRFETEVGREIDALGAAFETTLARLRQEASLSSVATNCARDG